MAQPSDADLLELALGRLEAALDQLESAAGLSMERARAAALRVRELEIFADDRGRLAEDLDAANARAAGLANVNRDVSRRLDQTMDSIRSVLGQDT
jgi:hypothetical protein